MNVYDNLYINGAWVPPAADKGYAEVIDSSTEEVMAKVVQGGREDVDRAVAAARDASPPGRPPRSTCGPSTCATSAPA